MMVKCRECKKSISSLAPTCIKCGAPNAAFVAEQKRASEKAESTEREKKERAEAFAKAAKFREEEAKRAAQRAASRAAARAEAAAKRNWFRYVVNLNPWALAGTAFLALVGLIGLIPGRGPTIAEETAEQDPTSNPPTVHGPTEPTAQLESFQSSATDSNKRNVGLATLPDAQAEAPIDPGVYDPYKVEHGWEKLFAEWKPEGVRRIQRLREAAATTVARNPKCDAVAMSEVSDRSIPPSTPIVFVDCKNGERFYLGEGDVGEQVLSQTDKGARFSNAELVRACTEAVQSKLNVPASFRSNMWSISERQAPTTGNRVVEFSFSAMNRLGAKLPAKARCIATPEGDVDITIQE